MTSTPPLAGSEADTRRGRARFGDGRIARLLIVMLACILIVLPLVLPSGTQWFPRPGIYSGDEPHYLVILNSLRWDRDLELRNNYLGVAHGSDQAGRVFRGQSLDHHVSFYRGNRLFFWNDVFEAVPAEPTQPAWRLRPGADAALKDAPEYPMHPVGLPAIAALLLWRCGSPNSLEQGAVILTTVVTLAGYLLYRQLLARMTGSRFAIEVTALAVFIASPLWFYGRTFLTEAYVTTAIIGALVLAQRWPFLSGVALAAAITIKPQLAMLGPVLAFPALQRRDLPTVARLAVAPIAAVASIFVLNARFFGSPLHGSYPFLWGNPLDGGWNVLFSSRHGLLPFAPFLAIAVLGFGRLRGRGPLPWQVLASAALLFLLTSCWRYWTGGWCYGPRLMVPCIPLLAVGLIGPLEPGARFRRIALPLIGTTIAFSALVQVAAVRENGSAFDRAPLQLIEQWRRRP